MSPPPRECERQYRPGAAGAVGRRAIMAVHDARRRRPRDPGGRVRQRRGRVRVPPGRHAAAALVFGVKTAVAVSIVPNIVMDSVQLVRRGDALGTLRRFAWLI